MSLDETVDRPALGRTGDSPLVTDTASVDNWVLNPGYGQSLGRLPTTWTDEGEIYTDASLNRHTSCPIIDAEKHFSDPAGRYYMYYSGYRSTTMRLAYSNSIESGWTEHPDSPLFDTSLNGDLNVHVASPRPVYDPASGSLWLFAHSVKGGDPDIQFTFRASSADGSTGWAYDGKILTVPNDGTLWDGGERAYLRCRRLGSAFIGFYQGRTTEGEDSTGVGFTWSYSGEPGTWRTLPRPLFKGDHPSHDSNTPGLEKPELVMLNGQPHLILGSESDSTVKTTPWFGYDHTAIESFEDTNLDFTTFGVDAFHGPEKLYLTAPSDTDNTSVRLWSVEWSDLQ